MTTYYVSAQRGNDGNNGTSPATPWATVTKAVQTLVAGDTCYIGAGTYREKPVNVNAGTNGNIIQFIGDPDAQYVTGDTKGIVRITACDANEVEDNTNGKVWDCQKDYVTIKNVLVDGGYDGVYFSSGTQRCAENVVAVARHYGFYYGTNTNCMVIGGYYGFYFSTNTNCMAIGGNYGFYNGTNINCMAIGGHYGFYYGTNINCMAIGGYSGFYYGTNTNCMTIGGYYGFYNGTYTNCMAMACYYGYRGTMTANDCKYALCYTVSTGTIKTDEGYATLAQAPVMLWTFADFRKIIEAFDPWMFEGAKQWGKADVSAGDTDILGRARKMLGGALDIGPFAFSNTAPDFATYKTASPAVKITQKGMKLFEIPATGGEAITVKVQTKHTNTTGDKPQVLLRGDTITEQAATCTAASDTWQELTVTATPAKDEILTLVLYARDTAATAVSYFSDIKVG